MILQQFQTTVYLLMMVKCVFDPAIFYTNEEFMHKYNKNVNIQVEIEKPLLHVVHQQMTRSNI